MKRVALFVFLSVLSAFAQSPADVYVSPTGNDSTGTGSFTAPYQTCNKARQAIDAIIAANPGRTTPFIVLFRGGSYFVANPSASTTHCSFTSADNGLSPTVPVVYAAYPGETPILSGGMQVTGWTNNGTSACASNSCTDYSFQFASNPVYFESLWYGQSYSISSISCSTATVTAQVSSATELYQGTPFQVTGNAPYNGFGYAAATVTTTTNANDTLTFKAPGGSCPPASSPTGRIVFQQRRWRPRWNASGSALLGTMYGMAAAVTFPSTEPGCTVTNGSVYICGERFQYGAANLTGLPLTNVSRTANASTGCTGVGCCTSSVNSFPDGDMEVLMINGSQTPLSRVACIDTSANIIYFTNLVYSPYTTYNACCVPATGNSFLIENVDYAQGSKIPQTFFLDRSTSPWTLHYYAAAGENPNVDTVIVPQMSSVIVGNNISYLNVQGLLVEHFNWTPPIGSTGGYPDSRNGMQMSYSSPNYTNSGITAGVSFLNSNYTNWFANVVGFGDGVGDEFWTPNINSSTSHHIIRNDAFLDLAAGALRLGFVNNVGCSGCPGNTDTDANDANTNIVDNILIDGIGRVIPAEFATADGDMWGNTYRHFDIYDSYHGAINVCALNCILGVAGSTWHGTSFNLFQLNHCQFLGRGIVSDGFGCPYMNVGSPTSPTTQGFLNVIDSSMVNNVSDGGTAGEGFYWDNFTGSSLLVNSIAMYISDDCFWVTAGAQANGSPIEIRNNICAYSRDGGLGHGSPTWYNSTPTAIWQQVRMTLNVFAEDRTAASPFYIQRGCSSLWGADTGATAYTQYEFWDYNTYWNSTENFGSDALAFHNQTTQTACNNSSANWTKSTFANWQGTINSIAMNEDPHGQALAQASPPSFTSAQPCNGGTWGFNPTLASAPLTGFNYTATNSTYSNAGRANPGNVPVIPTVTATIPGAADLPCTSY